MLKWLMVHNTIYDISTFTHPGGNFIYANCFGREVSRFLNGSYGHEYLNFAPAFTHP